MLLTVDHLSNCGNVKYGYHPVGTNQKKLLLAGESAVQWTFNFTSDKIF